jgi:hypothetical protein
VSELPHLNNISAEDAAAKLTDLIARAADLETRATDEVATLAQIAFVMEAIAKDEREKRQRAGRWSSVPYSEMSPEVIAQTNAEQAAHLKAVRDLAGDFDAWYSEAVGFLRALGTGPQVLRQFQGYASASTSLAMWKPDEVASSIRDGAQRGANNLRGVRANVPIFAKVSVATPASTDPPARKLGKIFGILVGLAAIITAIVTVLLYLQPLG